MRTDKIRKYLIPNIPYLFILWAFLKLGTAYRLAAGNDFAHKLIGLGQMIGPALPKHRNISAIPMCGAAVLPPLPLIARGTFRGSSITPAGMWAGWEPRGSITSVRRPVLPNPVIWFSSKAPMTRRA